MANIIEAFNTAFTEEYALAKFFVYALPVFVCLNAYATGQFVLSGFCGFFVLLLLLGLLTCGINGMRENKQEILTFNVQLLTIATLKTAAAIIPQISIAVMIGLFVKELIPATEDLGQIPMIINLIVWAILISLVTTSYLAFTKHMDFKEAYNFKTILESVVDVFVNLVFFGIQIVIANAIFIGLMSYVFTVLNLPLVHPLFIFYCSFLVILNLSVTANVLSQASYDCIKGKDEDYKDKYKIGTTLATANFSGGISITSSGATPFTPGGITTSGTANTQQPPQNRAAQSRNHLNRTNRLGGKSFSSKQTPNRNTGSGGGTGRINRTGTGGGMNRNSAGGTGRNLGTGKNLGGAANRNTPNRHIGGGSGSTGGTGGSTPKRTFGNNRKSGGSGFGNNRRPGGSGFGNNKKKNDGGGFGGFFKK